MFTNCILNTCWVGFQCLHEYNDFCIKGKMVTHVSTTPMDYVKKIPRRPNKCILGWTCKKTLNVVGKINCLIFFTKKEISTVHLTNYINFNNSWNHANNLNHLDYDRNLVTILFNLVHGLFELWLPPNQRNDCSCSPLSK